MSAIPTRCWASFEAKPLNGGGARLWPADRALARLHHQDANGGRIRRALPQSVCDERTRIQRVHGIVISSVVPPLDSTLREVCERYFNPGRCSSSRASRPACRCTTTIRRRSAPTASSTAWRPSRSIGGPCIVVDFGTATTFDVRLAKGEYLGGVITPGIGISADALFAAHRAPAAGRHSQASARAGDQHRQQRAVGSVLRLSRPD